MNSTHHLSQGAYDRLRAELDELRTEGRIDIARKIEAARELGDLSENGDYHAAKDAQGQMEARIAHLTALLAEAEIVDNSTSDVVAAGSIVSVIHEDDTEEEQYLVGSIEEKRAGMVVVSPSSPMGNALLGRRADDEVVYEVSGRTQRVRIVRVGE